MRDWETLSRCERVRVELARGVVARPQLMVIDDLFDGLGVRDTRTVGRLLRSLLDELECGVLLGVSDLEWAVAADRVWRLDQGSLTSVSDRLFDPMDAVGLASELHERGYKDPAAMVMGSALEELLRKLAVKAGVSIERDDGSPQKADALNHGLGHADAYNMLQQKSVTAWLDLRNKAAHGRHSEYDAAQVSALIRDVRDFMTRLPA
jgi:ABC-type multidrug transport system ATPase subunit